MSMNDPVADMLNRVRNALAAGQEVTKIPYSKLKGEVCRVLKREGYISDYTVDGNVKKTLRVYLKYEDDRTPVIRGVKRDSKPGLRRYVSASDMPRVLGGMGIAVLTTSQGVMTGHDAREKGIGGEVICRVW
ncbi:MAG: 30S ribosomal protein S8 [Lentisphaerae bacterium]|nr:30S ribosomal protein S8 [Lentisphaerota bacterium]